MIINANTNPKVSIIVPNFNHSEFLNQRLESIFNQTFHNYEVIILDDCSTDNSLEIIEKYRCHPKISKIVINEKNSGSTFAQWKKGIELSKGDFIWIAESDDYCGLNFLEIAMKNLKNDSDLFYCKSLITDVNNNFSNDQSWWYEDIGADRWLSDFINSGISEVKDFLFKKNTIINASAVVFRNNKKIIHLLEDSQRMRYMGDWLFWMKYLMLPSVKISYSIETTNFFRFHGNVSRAKMDPDSKNYEFLQIFSWISKQKIKESYRREIANYFFNFHFFKKYKRDFKWNIKQAFFMTINCYYFGYLWLKYYMRKSP